MGANGSGLTAWSLVSASCSIRPEKRICRPAVPFTEATLPASVLMSYVGAALAVVSVPLPPIPATVATLSTSTENKATCLIASPPPESGSGTPCCRFDVIRETGLSCGYRVILLISLGVSMHHRSNATDLKELSWRICAKDVWSEEALAIVWPQAGREDRRESQGSRSPRLPRSPGPRA